MQKFCSLSLCCKRPGRPYGIQFYCLLWLPRAYKNIRASFSVLLITDSWNLFKCISVISIIHWQNKYSIYFRIKESNPGPAGTYGYKMLWPSSEDIPGPSFADDILGPSPEDAWTQLYSVLQIYAWTICSDFFEDIYLDPWGYTWAQLCRYKCQCTKKSRDSLNIWLQPFSRDWRMMLQQLHYKLIMKLLFCTPYVITTTICSQCNMVNGCSNLY